MRQSIDANPVNQSSLNFFAAPISMQDDLKLQFLAAQMLCHNSPREKTVSAIGRVPPTEILVDEKRDFDSPAGRYDLRPEGVAKSVNIVKATLRKLPKEDVCECSKDGQPLDAKQVPQVHRCFGLFALRDFLGKFTT
jgi:hypothetical protein